MAGTPTPSDTRFTLTMGPGRLFRMYLALPVAAAFALGVGLLASRNFVDAATFVGYITFCLAGLVIGVITVLYWKAERTLIVDTRGIQLCRSGKARRDIPWEKVARIRYGMAFAGTGVTPPQNPLFWVHVKGPSRGLSILSGYYAVAPHAFWDACLFAANMARERGVPVVQKDGLIRDFRP